MLPLVIRQTVNITNAGSNFTETTDLSTFGFLYGTFPAAPGVFVVASRYNTDVDLVNKLKAILSMGIPIFYYLLCFNYRLHLQWLHVHLSQHH